MREIENGECESKMNDTQEEDDGRAIGENNKKGWLVERGWVLLSAGWRELSHTECMGLAGVGWFGD